MHCPNPDKRICRISRRTREEFVYKHREEFRSLSKIKWFPCAPTKNIRLQVRYLAHRARVEMGYSEKYIDIDLVYGLQHIFKERNF